MAADVYVFLVESNPDDARRIMEILRESPLTSYRVDIHASLQCLMQALAVTQPDAILLDLCLPGANGIEAVSRVTGSCPEVPVVVLAGDRDEEMAVEAVAKGAREYLIKDDMDARLLDRTLRYAIERQKIRQERDMLECRLRQVEKMETLGSLAGGIAHDLNNILFPILGHTEMLLMDVPKGDPIHKRAEKIYMGGIRARDLVSRILTFSRRDIPVPGPIQLAPIIHEVVNFLSSSIPSSIEVRPCVNNRCAPVKIHPTQVHQILMNLSANASDAMTGEGGILTIKLEELDLRWKGCPASKMSPGVYAYLSVADTGTGMEKGIVNQIFDPFFTTKEKGKGTGMGMSIVHGIVENAGGTVLVQSNPGKGTLIEIFLPVHDTIEAHPATGSESLEKGNEHILLIDDEKEVLSTTKQMLEYAGYRVTPFSHAPSALEFFRTDPSAFDMVITDMTMPGMNGNRLAAELVKLRPGLPVLICTGFSEELFEQEAAKEIGKIMVKPVSLHGLMDTVRTLLNESCESFV
ncbi:MAG: response regulator [Desulfobacteraceae bacterium]|nr:response regulator [Desulfobacteraceae bacterium]